MSPEKLEEKPQEELDEKLKEELKEKLKEEVKEKFEEIIKEKMMKYVFKEQSKGDLKFSLGMGVLVLPIIEELLDKEEELLKIMTLPLAKGNAMGGSSQGNGILATTSKKMIVLIPIKKMLGKIDFKDIRLVDYINAKVIEQKGLKKMAPGTHLLDIKYRKLGKSRLYKPMLTFYYLHAEKAAYIDTLINNYKQQKYGGNKVTQSKVESDSDDPLKIAKKRLASGEISVEEFNSIKSALE